MVPCNRPPPSLDCNLCYWPACILPGLFGILVCLVDLPMFVLTPVQRMSHAVKHAELSHSSVVGVSKPSVSVFSSSSEQIRELEEKLSSEEAARRRHDVSAEF